jgi:hypothetical protein
MGRDQVTRSAQCRDFCSFEGRIKDSRGGLSLGERSELLFENANRFGIVGMFEPAGAGEIAERSLIHRRSEVSQGNFALSVGVGGFGAEETGFLPHLVLGGALCMVLHVHGRNHIAEDRCGLGESCGSAKDAKESDGEDGDLHKFIPVLGDLRFVGTLYGGFREW